MTDAPTELGLSGDRPVEIDIRRLLTTNLGIIGNPGSGKSRSIRKVLELAAGRAQRIVLDVEDEFYTLREASPSLIIAGGQNGDCPAKPENAAALARFLLESGVDAVIQLNDLGFDGQERFIAEFLQAMIDAPRSLWHPVLLVLDEVQRYAPNNAVAASLEAVKNFVMQGRKRTFGFVMATPRGADVSTKVRGTINNWLLGRASQTVDIGAVSNLLGISQKSAEARGLPQLREGEFWAFGPAIGTMPELIRVGDVQTTHLQPGQRNVPTPPAPDQIRAMLASLQVEPESAGQPQNGRSTDQRQVEQQLIEAEKRGYERGKADGFTQGFAIGLDRINDYILSLREQPSPGPPPATVEVPAQGVNAAPAPPLVRAPAHIAPRPIDHPIDPSNRRGTQLERVDATSTTSPSARKIIDLHAALRLRPEVNEDRRKSREPVATPSQGFQTPPDSV